MLDIGSAKRFYDFDKLQAYIDHAHNPAALLDTSEVIGWIKAKGLWTFTTGRVSDDGVLMVFGYKRNRVVVRNGRRAFHVALFDDATKDAQPIYKLSFRSEAHAPAAIELYTGDLRLKNYTLDISTRDAVRRLLG